MLYIKGPRYIFSGCFTSFWGLWAYSFVGREGTCFEVWQDGNHFYLKVFLKFHIFCWKRLWRVEQCFSKCGLWNPRGFWDLKTICMIILRRAFFFFLNCIDVFTDGTKATWVKLQVSPHESRQWPLILSEVRSLLIRTQCSAEIVQMISALRSQTSCTTF